MCRSAATGARRITTSALLGLVVWMRQQRQQQGMHGYDFVQPPQFVVRIGDRLQFAAASCNDLARRRLKSKAQAHRVFGECASTAEAGRIA